MPAAPPSATAGGRPGDGDQGHAPPPAAATRGRRPARRGRRRLGVVLLVTGAVVVGLLAWAGVALLGLRGAASAAAAHVRDVEAALTSGDTPGALAAGRAAAAQTARAHHLADAPPLRLASHLPVTGPLLTDTRHLAAAGDVAIGGGAVPVLEVLDRLGADGGGLLRADGSIDVDAVTGASRVVHRAHRALVTAQARASAVDPGRFPPAARTPVIAARDGMTGLTSALARADLVLAAAPDALGARGERSYLVVFQNPAEVRPTGGLFGTWASLHVVDGRVHLTRVGANDDFTGVRAPTSGLGPEQRAYYGERPVRLTNANLSPDFTVAAPLLVSAWESLGRTTPDAVVAVDPQGMAPLLGDATLEVPGGPDVSAATVVDVLLRQVYVDLAGDDGARTRYLSDVVRTVFARALDGGALTPGALRAVAGAARDGHVLAWSAEPALQDALVGAGIAGELPHAVPGAARVHLTNVDGSKLDYYLDLDVRTTCPADGAPASMVATLRQDAPATVPAYVASKLAGPTGAAGDATTHTLQVALYLAGDSAPGAVDVAGSPVGTSSGSEAGWRWARFDVELPRGEEVVVTAPIADIALTDVSVQPLVREAGVDVAPCSR